KCPLRVRRTFMTILGNGSISLAMDLTIKLEEEFRMVRRASEQTKRRYSLLGKLFPRREGYHVKYIREVSAKASFFDFIFSFNVSASLRAAAILSEMSVICVVFVLLVRFGCKIESKSLRRRT